MTVEPIPFKVTRYRCPHCPRTASRPVRIREHMARCWLNPDAKGCKTCKHFEAYGPEWDDSCGQDIDLGGRKPCETCGGYRDELFDGPCPDPGHVGDGREIKPGPIVDCDRWEAM